MDNTENSEKQISNAQMADMLKVILDMPDTIIKLHGLCELQPDIVLQNLHRQLKDRDLDWPEAAKLLGVTENTMKRWCRSKDLAETAKQKLVALLLLLLSLSNKNDVNTAVTELVSLSVSKLRKVDESSQDTNDHSSAETSLNSIFGVSGLIATAWYLSLKPTFLTSVSSDGG